MGPQPFMGYKDFVVMTSFIGIFSPVIPALSLQFIDNGVHGVIIHWMIGNVLLSVIGAAFFIGKERTSSGFSVWRVSALTSTTGLMMLTQIFLGMVFMGSLKATFFLALLIFVVVLFVAWRFSAQNGELDQEGARAGISGPYAAVAPLSLVLHYWLMRQGAGTKAVFLSVGTSIVIFFCLGSLVWITLRKRLLLQM